MTSVVGRPPAEVAALTDRWSLVVGARFEGAGASWVARATLADGTPVVLKIGAPHMEAEHEIDGLRFWAGDPTVHLLAADPSRHAMLLERCHPGTSLRMRPESDQDRIIATLLRRLWRAPATPYAFRPLSVMIRFWCDETRADRARWPDESLVSEGLSMFERLATPSPTDVLLATDLHAGNVLAAQREPWLVIDPKPFVGDAAYDATQHLMNCRQRLRRNPRQTIDSFADRLELDASRIRQWLFARLAAEPRRDWHDDSLALARALVSPIP